MRSRADAILVFLVTALPGACANTALGLFATGNRSAFVLWFTADGGIGLRVTAVAVVLTTVLAVCIGMRVADRKRKKWITCSALAGLLLNAAIFGAMCLLELMTLSLGREG